MGFKVVVDTLTPAARKWLNAKGVFNNKLIKVMMAAGLAVSKGSADRAPYKDGQIEKSHRAEIITSGGDRIRVEVSAGGTVDGVDVDSYIMEMHEGSYNLGPGSLRKQAANPSVRVGRKFMERSLQDQEDDIMKAIEDAIMGAIS